MGRQLSYTELVERGGLLCDILAQVDAENVVFAQVRADHKEKVEKLEKRALELRVEIETQTTEDHQLDLISPSGNIPPDAEEITPSDPPPAPEEPNDEEGDEAISIYEEGRAAARAGKMRASCPFPVGVEQRKAWLTGYDVEKSKVGGMFTKVRRGA